MRDERPLAAVPRGVWIALSAALAAQVAWQAARPLPAPAEGGLPPAPRAEALRVASLGEDAALARLTMLYLQAFNFRRLDYGRLIGWLRSVIALDPRSEYPLFAAARVWAENPDPARSRRMIEFVYREFLRDPARRWPAAAHVALLAKHRLHDLPLALKIATAIEQRATGPDVPLWARQMRPFILEDMNELDAARIVLGGMLESGRIRDPGEARFLRQRLKELEARLRKRTVK